MKLFSGRLKHIANAVITLAVAGLVAWAAIRVFGVTHIFGQKLNLIRAFFLAFLLLLAIRRIIRGLIGPSTEGVRGDSTAVRVESQGNTANQSDFEVRQNGRAAPFVGGCFEIKREPFEVYYHGRHERKAIALLESPILNNTLEKYCLKRFWGRVGDGMAVDHQSKQYPTTRLPAVILAGSPAERFEIFRISSKEAPKILEAWIGSQPEHQAAIACPRIYFEGKFISIQSLDETPVRKRLPGNLYLTHFQVIESLKLDHSEKFELIQILEVGGLTIRFI